MSPLKLLVAGALLVGTLNVSAVFLPYTFRSLTGPAATGAWRDDDPNDFMDFGFDQFYFSVATPLGDFWFGDYMGIPWDRRQSADTTFAYINGGITAIYGVDWPVFGSGVGFSTASDGLVSWTWSRTYQGVDYSMSGTGIFLRSDLELDKSDGEALPDMGSTLTLLAAGLLFIGAACMRMEH